MAVYNAHIITSRTTNFSIGRQGYSLPDLINSCRYSTLGCINLGCYDVAESGDYLRWSGLDPDAWDKLGELLLCWISCVCYLSFFEKLTILGFVIIQLNLSGSYELFKAYQILFSFKLLLLIYTFREFTIKLEECWNLLCSIVTIIVSNNHSSIYPCSGNWCSS